MNSTLPQLQLSLVVVFVFSLCLGGCSKAKPPTAQSVLPIENELEVDIIELPSVEQH